MRKFNGSIVEVDGRGEVLVTAIPLDDPVPRRNQKILANGEKRVITCIDITLNGLGKRGRMVGLVLKPKAKKKKKLLYGKLQNHS